MVNNITIQRPVLQAQDIKSWQDAVNAARSNTMPRRRLLHLLYANLALDGHHYSVTQTRTVGITNQRVAWMVDGAPEEEGNEVVERSVINTPWFHRFLEGAMSAVPFGTTVMELIMKAGEVVDVEVVPRANVVPEEGLVLYDVGNTADGINYLDDPYWSKYLIPVGHRLDYGAMMIAAPYIIYKRGGFSSWGQFMELFGQPIKMGTYNQYDEQSRKALFDALTNMGGAGTVVVPEGSNVEFIKADGGQGNAGSVFDTSINRCNQEISKVYLGQTLTTESGDKGARSLGEVHKQTQDDITLSDMRRIQFLLNYELRPRLQALGYPLKDGEFRFLDTTEMPLTDRIKVDMVVAQQVRVPEEYWYKTYGIAMPADGNYRPDRQPAPVAPPAEPEPEPKPEPEPEPADPVPPGEKKKPGELSAALCKLYGKRLEAAAEAPFDDLVRDPIWQAIVEGIHNGRIKPGDIDEDLMNWTANELTKAVMGGTMEEGGEQVQGESQQLQEWIRNNVAVFSGFKTYQTLREATDQLLDEEGNIRPFNQFRDRVKAIDQEYNVNYLKAEYEHAVASAQMAEQWQNYQLTKDELPFLRYDTAGDDRVRPVHAGWDGIILPIDHQFWATNYPPNGWGCRCDASQQASDAGGRKVNTEELAPAVGMFANNVGKDGIVFPAQHPYFNAPKGVAKKVGTAVAKLLKKPATTKKPAKVEGPSRTKPLGTPVSGALTNTAKSLTRIMKRTTEAIDSVHGDGILKPIPLDAKAPRNAYGALSRNRFTNKAVKISVKARGHHPHMTLAHEMGHWLDLSAIGPKDNVFGTELEVMRPVLKLIKESKATRQIQTVLDSGKILDKEGIEHMLHPDFYGHIEYLLSDKELWARAYAQYIALKSGDITMRAELKAMLELTDHKILHKQWLDDDFLPIAKGIDELFKAQGWLK